MGRQQPRGAKLKRSSSIFRVVGKLKLRTAHTPDDPQIVPGCSSAQFSRGQSFESSQLCCTLYDHRVRKANALAQDGKMEVEIRTGKHLRIRILSLYADAAIDIESVHQA
jgi:hypothetical protein